MSLPSTVGSGAVLLDGARYENSLAWLYQHFPSHQPRPLLLGTPYEPIADAGPILLDAPTGSAAYEAWRTGSEILDGVWLESDVSVDDLYRIMQRRARVFAPDGRELWLRLGDARPLYRAWLAKTQWPEGFWHRVERIWLRHEVGVVCAWHYEQPQQDMAVADQGIAARLTLDWPLLQALASQEDTTQDVDA